MSDPRIVLIAYLLISLTTLCIVARIMLGLVRVQGPSMSPTLRDGDVLLVLRRWPSRWLRKGQIVVCQFVPRRGDPAVRPALMHSDLLIKRIVGLPGDTLVTQITELPDSLRPSVEAAHDACGYRTWHIPSQHCFLKGDSPGYDSVIAGPIPLAWLRGIALIKLR